MVLMGREDQRRQEVRMLGEGAGCPAVSLGDPVCKRSEEASGTHEGQGSHLTLPCLRGRVAEFPNTFLSSEPGRPPPTPDCQHHSGQASQPGRGCQWPRGWWLLEGGRRVWVVGGGREQVLQTESSATVACVSGLPSKVSTSVKWAEHVWGAGVFVGLCVWENCENDSKARADTKCF